MNYIYTGKLAAVNDTYLVLQGARVVYETGDLTASEFKVAQNLAPKEWCVMLAAIESFGRRR